MSDAYADWKGWDAREFGRFSASDARYFGWHVERALCNNSQRADPMRVLEVGFGNGRFMGWLRERGHSVTGIETNPHLVTAARAAGFDACATAAALQPDDRFDLIAAFDVLEHVPAADMQGFVGGLVDRLQGEGRLLLRFPNGESPFGLWMQQGDSTHVNAIGLGKLRQLCVACNLRLEHSGEALPWRAQPSKRRVGEFLADRLRRLFEWALRKMYKLPRGLDLSTNQLVVLSRVPASR